MAKVTWLGEPAAEGLECKEMEWMGLKFEKGKAVETDNQKLVEKARNNPHFKVEGEAKPKASTKKGKAEGKEEGTEEKPKPPESLNEVIPRPPSEQSAQGPVPKPGEPLGITMGPSPQPPPPGDLPPEVLPPVKRPDPSKLHRTIGSTSPGPEKEAQATPTQ